MIILDWEEKALAEGNGRTAHLVIIHRAWIFLFVSFSQENACQLHTGVLSGQITLLPHIPDCDMTNKPLYYSLVTPKRRLPVLTALLLPQAQSLCSRKQQEEEWIWEQQAEHVLQSSWGLPCAHRETLKKCP